MKKLVSYVKQKREGATLITVVIATAFLIAIGVIILAASTKYLASVYVDRNSNENMYDAEGVLSEVRTGLLEYAGNAAEIAYKDVVEHYGKTEFVSGPADSSVTATQKERFAKLYILGILDQLDGKSMTEIAEQGLTHSWPVPVAAPEGEPSEGTSPESVTAEYAELLERAQFPLSSLSCLTQVKNSDDSTPLKKGSFVSPSSETVEDEDEDNDKLVYEIYKTKTNSYYLMIRNVVVDYTDEAGYHSTVQTDIKITPPDYKFGGGTTEDELYKYLSVSDGNLVVGEPDYTAPALPVSFTNGADLDGNVYVGGYQDKVNLFVSPGADDTMKNMRVGIEFGTDAKAHFNCEKLVTRGNIQLNSGSKAQIYGVKNALYTPPVEGEAVTDANVRDTADGSVYAKNIILKQTKFDSNPAFTSFSGTELTLKSNSYIENDLDIQDRGTKVRLGGRYLGYSFNQTNDGSLATSKAEYSSAILINGHDTTLLADEDDTLSLKRLVLSGRAFVSREGESDRSLEIDRPDIMLGESVGVRSNQLAYLVPARYVLAKHNPVTKSDVNRKKEQDFYDATTLVDKDALESAIVDSEGNSLLADVPVTANYAQYTAGGYAYLFLNFKNQHSANTYFQRFYNGEYVVPRAAKEKASTPYDFTVSDLKERFLSYISTKPDGADSSYKDFGLRLSPAYFLIAANIVNNINQDGGLGFQSANYFDGLGAPSATILSEGVKIGRNATSLQKTLSTGNSSDMRLDPDNTAPVVKDELIKTDKIDGLISGFANKRLPMSDGKYVNVMCMSASPGTPNNVDSLSLTAGDERVLLIHKGDFTISPSTSMTGTFSGLLIVDGDVNVSADFTGLIIATGTVRITGDVNMKSDQRLVKQLFEYAKSDSQLMTLFGNTTPETHDTTKIEECFRYVNWTKNSY